MRLLLPLLFGCASPLAAPSVAPPMPPPPPLQLAVVGAPVAGQPITLNVAGAGAGERVHLASAAAEGAGTCIPSAGGACLEITGSLQYLGNREADDTGVATFQVPTAGATAGDTLALQGLTIRGLQGSGSVLSVPLTVTLGDALQDADGDGFTDDVDCDDDDATVHPGAAELCDAVDNDCDPSTAEPTIDLNGFRYAYLDRALLAAKPGSVVSWCQGTVHRSVPTTITVPEGVTLQGSAGSQPLLVEANALVYGSLRDLTLGVERGIYTESGWFEGITLLTDNSSSQDDLIRVREGAGFSDVTVVGAQSGFVFDIGGANSEVHLDRVTITDHTGTGPAIRVNGDVLVVATNLTLHRNTGGGLLLDSGSTVDFTCTDCDFGVGPTDNQTFDLRDLTATYAFLWDDVDFTCTDSRCTIP